MGAKLPITLPIEGYVVPFEAGMVLARAKRLAAETGGDVTLIRRLRADIASDSGASTFGQRQAALAWIDQQLGSLG